MASDTTARRAPRARVALAACLALAPALLGATVYHDDAEALRLAFPSASRFSERSFPIDDATRARVSARVGYEVREHIVVLEEAWRDAELVGRALILEEKGKTLPFRFLTALTPQGAVDQVLLLAYRESRGDEIGRPAFRAQYAGKTLSDPIRRGEDIRNVTGATISVDSLSRGVRRALAFAETLGAPDVARAPDAAASSGTP